MPAEPPLAARPYHAAHYDLGRTAAGRTCTLAPIAAGEADVLGAALAAIDPWAAYGIPPARLAAFFADESLGVSRRAIRIDGRLAGIVVVANPWLAGPYLQFLGFVPGEEGGGGGGLVLAWMEREAPAGTRNLWLCVSSINTRARAFYERHGYVLQTTIGALVADHIDEHLMRKRLVSPAS